jgi:hypothetical protein
MDRTVEEVARGILVFVDAHAVAVALAEQEQRPALPLRRRLRSPPRRRATRSATSGAAGRRFEMQKRIKWTRRVRLVRGE